MNQKLMNAIITGLLGIILASMGWLITHQFSVDAVLDQRIDDLTSASQVHGVKIQSLEDAVQRLWRVRQTR